MKPASLVLAAAAALAVSTTACEGLKQAFSAHVDTAARAGTQELSVERLAALLGESTVLPRADVGNAIANAWVDYQSLAAAAASGDTTINQKTMDAALWAAVANVKARKYYALVSKGWGATDTAAARKMYDNGDILAASHILILTQGATPAQKAALKAKAEALRAQATSSNFAALARTNSMDRQSAQRGGSLGLFPRGAMVPQFEQALLALKPGQISPVVETQYGYHIIRRPTYDEVKNDVLQAAHGRSLQVAESTFVTKLQSDGKLALRSNAATTARSVITNPGAHLNDNTTIATSAAGNFTAGRLAQWMETFPPMVQAQQRAQLPQAPDSVLQMFVKQFVTNDLVIHEADSLKLGLAPEEMAALRTGFIQARDQAWKQLGVDPKSLADSAKTPAARATLAAARVEKYMDALVAGHAQYVQVPGPVSEVMRQEEHGSVNQAGVDRAVDRAVKAHAAGDSTRQAAEPPTAVPLPGGSGAAAGSAAPTPATPAPATHPAGASPAPTGTPR